MDMYKHLTKEEQKEVRKNYVKTKRGSNLSYTLNKLVIEGLFLLVCTVIIIAAGLFTKEMTWWMWTLSGITTFCGLLFLIGQYILRIMEYNKFIKYDFKPSKKKLTKRK